MCRLYLRKAEQHAVSLAHVLSLSFTHTHRREIVIQYVRKLGRKIKLGNLNFYCRQWGAIEDIKQKSNIVYWLEE